ncbi:hypothetical protein LFX25_07060 [Leptospira sp. FAT2]|uniref:hypothetical protein n=1 Tax=Leptospira sanjuanensis TaxID=2879643 RepID=UPI001EE8BE7C|nr:hypothetical protein [Leptospira sanjuanensis]MCG6192999.1 hypothetical protein [Leptospira sanjuanensis]
MRIGLGWGAFGFAEFVFKGFLCNGVVPVRSIDRIRNSFHKVGKGSFDFNFLGKQFSLSRMPL